MTISIVIRCKNEEEAIGLTLEKIRSQEIDIPYAEGRSKYLALLH